MLKLFNLTNGGEKDLTFTLYFKVADKLQGVLLRDVFFLQKKGNKLAVRVHSAELD